MASSLVKGSGCGTREWREDFDLSASDGLSVLKVPQAGTGELVVNDGSKDLDFRVESDAEANMFVVDAGASTVSIGSASDAKASLAISSFTGTKGLRLPLCTTTQRDAIASPGAGLMVYNSTTNKLNFYNGSAWEAVTSA